MSPQQFLPCSGIGTGETSPSPSTPHSTALEVALEERESRRLLDTYKLFYRNFLSLILGWCLLAF